MKRNSNLGWPEEEAPEAANVGTSAFDEPEKEAPKKPKKLKKVKKKKRAPEVQEIITEDFDEEPRKKIKVKKKKKKVKTPEPETVEPEEVAQLPEIYVEVPERVKPLTRKQKRKIEDKLKAFKSEFKEDLVQQLDLLKQESDTFFTAFHKSAISTILRLIPVAEHHYLERPGESSARALNGHISSIRELIADVKADRDQKELAQRIVQSILYPSFMRIAQNLHDNMRLFEQTLRPLMIDNARNREKLMEQLSGTTRQIAQFLQESCAEIGDKIENEIR